MPPVVRHLLSHALVQAFLIAVASVLAGYIIEATVHRALARLAARTATKLDDRIVEIIRRPMFLTAVLAGFYWAASRAAMHLSESGRHGAIAIIITLLVLIWSQASMRVGTVTLQALSSGAKPGSIVQPSSLPLFEIGLKVVVVVAGIYFVFLAWHLDLTAWAASAGIIGVAVGFAAKDSLSNLFAGIFIIADAPYKVGDFIVLEGGLRGRVTAIGIRSTRILTLENVEITVPNGIIAGSRIVNEAGGPNPAQRLSVKVSAAYGSDVDQVRDVLLACADGVDKVCSDPKPEVRFVSFGDSGLDFQLLVWVTEPALRDPVLSVLNTRVYKAFAKAGIEIPYPKRDVYVKELPGRGGDKPEP